MSGPQDDIEQHVAMQLNNDPDSITKAEAALLDVKGNKYHSASELIANLCQKHLQIFTIRSDQQPEMWVYRSGIYVAEGSTYVEQMVRAVLGEKYNSNVTSQVINKLRADTYILPRNFFDSEPKTKICVRNGILDVVTGNFTKHTPMQYHFSKLPVDYDPDASCDKIKDFFRTILKDPEKDLDLIQEITGWFLLKEYKPEKSVMMHGSGGNGKTKAMEIWERFLGEDNFSNVGLQELDPTQNAWSVGYLHKKLANFGGDLSSGHLKDSSIFKQATGRNMIKAERKHRDPIRFRNYAKMVFACNQLPRVYEDVEGFWRRWIMIDFPYKFLSEEEYEERGDEPYTKKRDPEIVDKVLDDDQLSGMLNWALEGLNRLTQRNEFTYSTSQQELRVSWLRRSDSFAAFCMDHLEQDWSGGYITKTEMRRAYSVYCRRNKLKQNSDRQIKRTLQEQFGADEGRKSMRHDNSRSTCWEGVRFVDERDHEEEEFSWSIIGFEDQMNGTSRVKRLLVDLADKSDDGLVSVDELEERLPGVDVQRCLEVLAMPGEVYSPRAGYWRLME